MLTESNKAPQNFVPQNWSFNSNAVTLNACDIIQNGKVVSLFFSITPKTTGWITAGQGFPSAAVLTATVGTGDGDGRAMANICRLTSTGEIQMYITDTAQSSYSLTYIAI